MDTRREGGGRRRGAQKKEYGSLTLYRAKGKEGDMTQRKTHLVPAFAEHGGSVTVDGVGQSDEGRRLALEAQEALQTTGRLARLLQRRGGEKHPYRRIYYHFTVPPSSTHHLGLCEYTIHPSITFHPFLTVNSSSHPSFCKPSIFLFMLHVPLHPFTGTQCPLPYKRRSSVCLTCSST